jgi:hypothetical protein
MMWTKGEAKEESWPQLGTSTCWYLTNGFVLFAQALFEKGLNSRIEEETRGKQPVMIRRKPMDTSRDLRHTPLELAYRRRQPGS